jgi:iron complex outermembrane receptor protein
MDMSRWSWTVSLAAFGVACAVNSQAHAQAPQGDEASADAAADGEDGAETSGGLGDIVVTAQRRGENLQKVPIAISAVDSAMASAMGIKTSQDIIAAAPAVTFAETSSGANITIRGVGGSGSAADEAANAVYIDGVYQAAAPALVFNLIDLERVEVAKGPQGTLFGRNSTGGVIQIITRNPTSSPSGSVSLGYGNYGTVEAQAYFSGGITDNLAGSIAGYSSYQKSGWGTNVLNGRDAYRGRSTVVRGKLKWDIGEDTTAVATYMYSDGRTPAANGSSIVPGLRTVTAGGVAGTTNVGFYNINQNFDSFREVKQHQVALTFDHDFGWAKLVNISAYSHTRNHISQDSDYGPADPSHVDLINPVTTFTNETQLLSDSGSPVRWTLGAFYMYNKIALSPSTFGGSNFASVGGFQTVDDASRTNSYSIYGQTTVPVFEGTNITGGLRYTVDDRSLQGTLTNGSGVTVFDATTTDKKLTWRLALDQQITRDILGYISYNRGYKSGLYNIATPSQPSVGPEVVDAYEVGLKTQWFDNKVRLNVAGFYYDFTGIQLRATASTGTSFLLNAASAKIHGVDVDLTLAPSRNLTIHASGSYLHSRYGSFTNALFYTPRATGGLIQSTGDATGNDLVYSPKWVGDIGANYRIPTSVGTFSIAGNVYYNGGLYFDPQNRFRQGEYVLLNSSLDWTDESDSFGLRFWVRNLTKEKYYTSMNVSTFGAQYFPGAPRTYGVTAHSKF